MKGAQCCLPKEAAEMRLASTVWCIVCAAQLTFNAYCAAGEWQASVGL